MSSSDTKSWTFGGNIYENKYHIKLLKLSLINQVLSGGGKPQGLEVANICLKNIGFNEQDKYFNVTQNVGQIIRAHEKYCVKI